MKQQTERDRRHEQMLRRQVETNLARAREESEVIRKQALQEAAMLTAKARADAEAIQAKAEAEAKSKTQEEAQEVRVQTSAQRLRAEDEECWRAQLQCELATAEPVFDDEEQPGEEKKHAVAQEEPKQRSRAEPVEGGWEVLPTSECCQLGCRTTKGWSVLT